MVDKIDVSDSIREIGFALKNSDLSHYEMHKKNQRIDVKKKESIYYIETGKISFHRVNDDVLTITMNAPCVAGIAQMLFQYQTHYIRCNQECNMWVINIEDAIHIFSKNNLWVHAYNILAKQIQQYFEREYLILQKTSKDMVLQNISYIWDMTEEERNSISIYTFILERNHISRSNVHKILADLEKNNVIQTNKGRLIDFKIK